MTTFLQTHFLTFFPPSNLNRDDTGRPKSAVVGGVQRLRLSSQSLKRAWRSSAAFSAALAGHMGERTQRVGEVVLNHLTRDGMEQTKAIAVAREIAGVFGKMEFEKDSTRTKQLVFVSPEERAAALEMANQALAGEKIDPKPASLLRRSDTAADVAMFGRMLADASDYNRTAAVQVAHAITTHKVTVEDDYYTAVDDLKLPSEDAGAAFLGEAAFGSGVFYLYLSINVDLLVSNLSGNAELASTAIGALIEAAATTAPSGKQASFAALARAHYVLVECGTAQPRTLAGAFAKPVSGDDLMACSIDRLRTFRSALDAAYGPTSDKSVQLEVGGDGTLAGVVQFARQGVSCTS